MSSWISLAATWWGEGWRRVNPHYWPSSSVRPLEKQKIKAGQLTIHADRGSSMRSKPVAFLLADLGETRRTAARTYQMTTGTRRAVQDRRIAWALAPSPERSC